MRKTSIQCQKPNCGTRHVALLQNEAPPVAPRCIACDTPLPPTVTGEFVYFAVAPSTSESRTMQAAPDRDAAPDCVDCSPPLRSARDNGPSLDRQERAAVLQVAVATPSSGAIAYPTALRAVAIIMSRIAFLLHLPSIVRARI